MTPFQYDRPTFVQVEFNGSGRDWKLQEHFPWKELSVDQDTVEGLYNNEYLYHDSEQEAQAKVGDGLEALDNDGLAKLVDAINEKVKAATKTQTDFDRRKCKKSRIVDKQRGLIRSWRRNHGQLESD